MFWGTGVILSNADIVYMKVNLQAGKKKNELLSQHDFRMKVAMAWINPEIYFVGETDGPAVSTWKKRKRREAHSKSYCDEVQVDVPQKLRAAKLDDDNLREHGRLCIRLDRTKVHYSEVAKPHARCSVHRWLGFETQKNISYCETCNVNLCQFCNKYFHTTPNITSEKQKLKRKFTQEHNDAKLRREQFKNKK